jgi:hypothetical protein
LLLARRRGADLRGDCRRRCFDLVWRVAMAVALGTYAFLAASSAVSLTCLTLLATLLTR